MIFLDCKHFARWFTCRQNVATSGADGSRFGTGTEYVAPVVDAMYGSRRRKTWDCDKSCCEATISASQRSAETLLLRFPQRFLKRLLDLIARDDCVLPHVGETVERIARTLRPQLDDSP